MSIKSIFLALVAATMFSSLPAWAEEIEAYDQGSITHYSIISPHGPTSSYAETGPMAGFTFLPVSNINTNYFAGFDLTGVSSGTVHAANIFFTIDSTLVLPAGLYENETAEIDLLYNALTNSPATDVSQYGNLQTGDVIGTAQIPLFAIPGSTIEVDLNSQGVLDLNNTAGGSFTIGGDITSAPNSVQEFEVNFASAKLNINPAAVPEPSTWALILGSCLGLAVMREYQRRTKIQG
jgi:hypothetical protein